MMDNVWKHVILNHSPTFPNTYLFNNEEWKEYIEQQPRWDLDVAVQGELY
jgi:hypothetical protein